MNSQDDRFQSVPTAFIGGRAAHRAVAMAAARKPPKKKLSTRFPCFPRLEPTPNRWVLEIGGRKSYRQRRRQTKRSRDGLKEMNPNSVVEATANSIAPEPAFKAVEKACKDALNLWPNANAAVLFGSRARGDYRDGSDWDIAFITSTEESLPCAALQEMSNFEAREGIRVQAQAISQEQFHEGADSLGNIAAPVAREGHIIAGHCQWPETESNPVLKSHEYINWRSGALARVASAAVNLATAIDSVRAGNFRSRLGDFVADTSDAAERFAKIVFRRLASGTGAAIPRRHQINEIETKLDRVLEHDAGPGGLWWRSDSGEEFRELLRMMNGHGEEDHQAGYSATPDADAIARAANRLITMASLATREVEELPDPGGLRQAAMEVACDSWVSILGSARRLRQSLREIDPNDFLFSATGSRLAQSASAAAKFGEEIAQTLEKLADDLYAEMAHEDRARVNPIIYVVGTRPNGKPLAIADNPEAIMDRADDISRSRLPRKDAGLELLGSSGFFQALRILGFTLEPLPRLFTESEAVELVKKQQGMDFDEIALRTALGNLLRGREIGPKRN